MHDEIEPHEMAHIQSFLIYKKGRFHVGHPNTFLTYSGNHTVHEKFVFCLFT